MSYEAGVAETLGKQVVLLLPDKYPVAELPADFASTTVLDFDPQAPEVARQKNRYAVHPNLIFAHSDPL